MPQKTTVLVRPTNLEKETTVRLSALDINAPTYVNFALHFQLAEETDRYTVAKKLERALEKTVTQAPHLASRIEPNERGDYSMVTRAESALKFVVAWLDEPNNVAPSFEELELASFSSGKLGNPADFTVEGLTPLSGGAVKRKPSACALQLTFIPGGAVLIIQVHHWSMDLAGVASVIHQIAANCHDLESESPAAAWDDSLVSRERFILDPVPEPEKKDSMVFKGRHPDWKECAWLCFHIPHSQTIRLKELASPTDGTWISTYDAVVALIWRTVTRNRAQVYSPDLQSLAQQHHTGHEID